MERMPSGERREAVLEQAGILFGLHGFAGTSTEQIAAASGITQSYVVRLFGSKENLVTLVLERSIGTVLDRFRSIIETGHDLDTFTRAKRLGDAYIELIQSPGTLRALLQAFMSGADPTVGPIAREGFLSMFRLLRDDAGFSPEQTVMFIANGMIINSAFALDLPAHAADSPDINQMLKHIIPGSGTWILHDDTATTPSGETDRPDSP